MTTKINQPVQVLAVFGAKNMPALPLRLSWNSKTYELERPDFVHTTNIGAAKIYHFSVVDKTGGIYFKLAFNSTTLKWRIEEIDDEPTV